MKSLFKSKKRNYLLLLSSLLLCLSCSEEIIDGGAVASGNESADQMLKLEQAAREKFYPDADVSEPSMAAPKSRATADDMYRMSWMGKLDDKVLLTNLTIPGTHDSAADTDGGFDFARCHYLSIQRQLELGVRAFDIRCRHISNSFAMHHGVVYLNKMFGKDVRDVFIKFLREHPTETIIMMAKEEHTATGNTRSFEETMASYMKGCEEFFLLDERDGLTLGDARRKIVMLRRFNSSISPFGHKINVGDNTVSESFTTIRASIQDCYSIKLSQSDYKWTQVRRHMERACGLSGNNLNPQILYINFLSGGAFPDGPLAIASGGGYRWGMNKCLNTDMSNPMFSKARLGIVYLDFAGTIEPDLIPKLINSNMGKGLEPYQTGHYASSEELTAEGGKNGPAIRAFDDNDNTYWMSQWTVYKRTFPHSLTMDLGSSISVGGISFTNRLGVMSGRPSNYTVEYSKDGKTWIPARISASDQMLNAATGGSWSAMAAAATAAAKQRHVYLAMGTLNTNLTKQRVQIDWVSSARFVRVNFLSARDNTYYVHLAEMYTF